MGCELKDDTNDEDDGCGDEGVSTTEFTVDGSDEEGTKEAASLKCRYNLGAQGGNRRTVETEPGLEGGEGNRRSQEG